MARDGEAFLSRWSRLKREQAERPPAPPEPAPATAADTPEAKADEPPPLPPVESLTPESDFRPFMDARVSPDTRRAALKRLFADPQFSVPDPYEAYSGDWTGGDPIPPEMLQTLHQAKRVLFDEPPPPPTRDEPEEAEAASPPAALETTDDAVDAVAATTAMPETEKAVDGGT